jgi:hypothetical protein
VIEVQRELEKRDKSNKNFIFHFSDGEIFFLHIKKSSLPPYRKKTPYSTAAEKDIAGYPKIILWKRSEN